MRPKRPEQPRWLSLYLQCKKFHTLLFDGGLLDQPVELWELVSTAGEIYEEWLQERQQEQEAGEKSNAELWAYRMGR